ncbi:HAD-IA family hydrolase [Arcobacter sp.]|uniref:HAD-IA family hydrolase n=1 Tax=Arcobacter sp. TaxID=1872629 RepID=UPI003C741B96
MNIKHYNNYIFDFDGTIVNLNANWPLLKKDINGLCGKYNININQKLNIKIDLLKEKVNAIELFDIIKEYEQNNSEIDFTPINNTLNFIDKLDYLFIISNNLSSTVKKTLNKLGITKKSIIIIGIDNVQNSKPNIESYNKLKPFLKEGSSIYIGDKETDFLFANNCQINFKYKEVI